MANKKHSRRRERFRWWFSRKKKKADPFDSRAGITEDAVEEDAGFCGWSMEMDPRISTHELRVFVGTWNVAGRSPVRSLAADLDEWLNLKDIDHTADVYVLGFQEIVPLNPQSIIAGENATEATNWNMLIGKTLNDKYGCPWLTPMLNPINSDDYYYSGIPETERRYISRSQITTQLRSQTRSQTGQSYRYSRYKLIASKKMVGVFISVWIRRELLKAYSISDVRVCSVACGIMGYLGNKGSVSVSMSIGGTSFCFIAAHLASGEKKGDEGKRNYQVSEIFRRTSFPRLPRDGNLVPPTILGHDRVFLFGDLNYRLYLEDNLARELIRKQDWKALQEFDQLQKELEDGGVFQGWKEGSLEFPPTYKYSSTNSNRYSGGLPSRAREKQRTPAWCDRILWYGKGVKQISYFRSESKFSDHRPVSALFSAQIEADKRANCRLVVPALVPSGTPCSIAEQANGEATTTLTSLIKTDADACPTNR
ncbi:type I inositol polyphosphate 5-phosphatase 4-like isoform X1 [Coffea arabica]|uniref:Type I inositol polyphosphate 5-phosphatase 4-like isoform X1 n=1 Tax=Coffea arabica TaxID=13443 RepID=A0ABM4VAA3_COFAR|nr:type IV inositol polyphosphate 5-phosphatase 6-like isoform X2 [Coffea arabica]